VAGWLTGWVLSNDQDARDTVSKTEKEQNTNNKIKEGYLF
jgi:hypothetical protein